MTELEEHLEIDKKKVIDAIRLQTPIEVTTYSLPRNMEAYFRGVEEMFLKECHQEHLQEYVNFCLGELLANSKKANTKRIYFKEKNLDLNDPDDYAAGMEHFKDDTFSDLDYYLELQKKNGLYVKLCLQYRGDRVIIEIRNNSVLCDIEKSRIQHKLATAQQYDNMDEVVANVIDQSEGAGLGIIIIVLMLQKVGYSKNNFNVFSTDTETVTQIILPSDPKIAAAVDIISYEFINLTSKVPVIKSNFEKINEIVQAKKIDRNKLLDLFRRDLLLSIVLLKYALGKDPSCFSLTKALELMSDDELIFIFSDSNPKIEIIEPTKEIEELLEHAYNVAFFTYNLYKNSENLGVDDEFMFLLGLFSNSGAIALAAATEEQKACIKEFSEQYEGISDKIQDMFAHGYANNYMNQVLAKRFKFSDRVAKVLNKWVCIEDLEEEHQPIAKVLHVAEMLQNYAEGRVDYYQLDKSIMAEFNISNEDQFKYLLEKMQAQL